MQYYKIRLTYCLLILNKIKTQKPIRHCSLRVPKAGKIWKKKSPWALYLKASLLLGSGIKGGRKITYITQNKSQESFSKNGKQRELDVKVVALSCYPVYFGQKKYYSNKNYVDFLSFFVVLGFLLLLLLVFCKRLSSR